MLMELVHYCNLNCLKVSSNIKIYILKSVLKTLHMSLAVVAHTCNPGTQEAVEGGSL